MSGNTRFEFDPAGGEGASEDLRKRFLRTRSGRHFRPFAPSKHDFTYDDICFGLARINRFGGQCERYSVAEHSVLVATIVRDHFHRPDLVAAALFHDAPEAFYGDMISPIRRGMPEYNRMYAIGEAVVLDALGVKLPLPQVVVEADGLALALEARDFYNIQNPRAEWNIPFDPLLAPQWVAEREGSEVWAEALFRSFATAAGVERSW